MTLAQPELNVDDKKDVYIDQQQEDVLDVGAKLGTGQPKEAGLAVIDITHTIPTTGKRKVTTKWEYWTYCAFCEFPVWIVRDGAEIKSLWS
jgi:hypothetical protein